MTKPLMKHADMTNAEFEKKLRQECENNEELREEINEITGIFRRAIAKGYPNFDNRDEFYNEIDDMLKGKKPVFIRDVISKEDLQEVKEIRKRLCQVDRLIGNALGKLRFMYIFINTGENKDKFNSIIKSLEDLEGSLSISRNKSLKHLNYVSRVVESLERELKEDE
jgi:hypothetical protein